MEPLTVDIHSHVEFSVTFELLKKRYTEEEIFYKFVVPATGYRSAELNKKIVSSIREALRNPEKKIRDMDAKGVKHSILSSTPFSFFYEIEEDLSVELAKLQNDLLSEMVKKYPDRFSAIATLPLNVPNEAKKELERAIEKLNLKGIEIGSHVGKRELGEKVFWPIYEVLERVDLPMFIHPHHVAGIERLQDFYLSNLIGNPLDTTIAAAQLIFHGVLERFPNLKVILAHGGGQLPYIFGRLEHGYRVRPEPKEKIGRSPRTFLKNFYCDTITHSPEALSYLISLMGSDHVLMGTDYPYDMGDEDPIRTIEQQKTLSEEDRQRIMGGNAKNIFKLTGF